MIPLILEIDASPLGGWPGEEIDHVGMQLSLLENRPLVGAGGLLEALYRDETSWIARLNPSAKWSDGRSINALEVMERFDEVAESKLGWPLRVAASEGRFETRLRSSLEFEISGLSESVDLAALLRSPIYTPRRSDAVTGSFQRIRALPSIGGACFRSTLNTQANTFHRDLILTNLEGSSSNVALWKERRLDVTCPTGTFPADLRITRRLPQWIERPTFISVHLLLNPQVEVFRDPIRRRATAAVLHRKDIVAAAGHLADALEFPSDILTDPSSRRISTDRHSAPQPIVGSEQVTLLCSNFVPNPKVAASVAEQLQQVGFDVQIDIQPWLDFVSQLAASQYDLALALLPLSYHTRLGAVLQSFAASGVSNWLNVLLSTGQGSHLPSWQRLEAYSAEVVPSVPLYTIRAGSLMSDRAQEIFRLDVDGLVYPRSYDKPLSLQECVEGGTV